jgi:hypothetical protein
MDDFAKGLRIAPQGVFPGIEKLRSVLSKEGYSEIGRKKVGVANRK